MKSPISSGAREPNSPSAPPPNSFTRRLLHGDLPVDTVALAQYLLGTVLVRRCGDDLLAGRIVETEAYGLGDPASHAYRGRTKRNAAMFARRGHLYVYRIYGSSWCCNVASEGEGDGAAVLLRALEPVAGVAAMRTRRGPAVPDRDLARGPGRLCAALEIGSELDRADLDTDERVWLAPNEAGPPVVGRSTRIGLTRAADVRHRFYLAGSRWLSGPRALSP